VDGKGDETGTEMGGTKTAQQQSGPKGSEDGKGKEPGDKIPSQMAGKSGNKGQDDSAEGLGESMQKQTGQKQGSSEGGKGEMQSSSDLKTEIDDQMAGLSSQISALEKEMGLETKDGLDDSNSQEEQNALHHEETKSKRKKLSREEKVGTDEKEVPSGDKPGEKLYSAEPEKNELPGNAENMKMIIEGEKDELGTLRETVSTGKGNPSGERRKLPTVGYDDTVKRSEEQAEDDAIRKTSIPLEYEDIIKKIHSDKE
ncbi:MAG: hypothetical protein NUV86_08915, partial [Candidatus Scalindua sp.]|nr:hypothetical protein [Candidatus Scalindua sp.]